MGVLSGSVVPNSSNLQRWRGTGKGETQADKHFPHLRKKEQARHKCPGRVSNYIRKEKAEREKEKGADESRGRLAEREI